jgi:anti-sigma regulatory factor (Ser/Thr protein kinase)
VRAWRRDDTLIVQVDDAGAQPVPVKAGFRQPSANAPGGGRGLWLARQLADTVAIHTTPDRTSVRLHFPRELLQRLPVA